jgi:hypothetical protein
VEVPDKASGVAPGKSHNGDLKLFSTGLLGAEKLRHRFGRMTCQAVVPLSNAVQSISQVHVVLHASVPRKNGQSLL